MAFIAVGAAVALAATVVAVGMTSGESDDASSATAVLPSPGGSLPAGHPSIQATATAAPTTGDEVQKNIDRLEDQSAAAPGDVDVLLDLGDTYFLGQHLQQAGHAFGQALREDPGNPTARVGLAMVWHAQGDSAKAEEALRAVLAAHPDSQEAHYSLAIVSFSEGHIEEARTEWKTAARIDPASATGRRSQSFVDLLDNKESATPSSGD